MGRTHSRSLGILIDIICIIMIIRHLYSAFYQRMQSTFEVAEKRWVLRAFSKNAMLVEFLTDEGNWYQRRGAETKKETITSQGAIFGDITLNAFG